MKRSHAVAGGIGCLAAAWMFVSDAARAGGIEVRQGGPSLGNAGAGAPATADDPSTVWFNPAGMSAIEEAAASPQVNAIRTSARWSDAGSATAFGSPLRGGDGRSAGGGFLVPGLQCVVPVDERWRLGFSLNAPFGLVTDYGDAWAGRYHATRTALESVHLRASAARSVTDSLSFGAGIDVQHVRAIEQSAIDFGTIAFATLGPAAATGLGLAPQEDDGRVSIDADDLSFGWNAGLHWRPHADTSVGLAFRSAIRHHLEGDATFRVPTAATPLLASGAFRDTGASADLTIPESLSLGVAHRLDAEWTLLGGVDWTRWARIDEIAIDFENPQQPDSVQSEHWRDTWRLSAGATWRPDPAWTFRAGVAYDPAPVPDRFRTPRVPDADRWWAAIGAGARLSENVRLDLAYVHEFVDRASIHQTSATAGDLRGSVRGAADYVSLQLTVNF